MRDGLPKARLAQFAGFSEAVFRRGLVSLSRRYPAWAVWLARETGVSLPFTLKPPKEGLHPYPLRVGLKPRPEVVWLPQVYPQGAVYSPDGRRFYLVSPPPVPPQDGVYLMTPISPPSFFRGEELSQSHLLPFARVLGEISHALLSCTGPRGEEVREGPLQELVGPAGPP